MRGEPPRIVRTIHPLGCFGPSQPLIRRFAPPSPQRGEGRSGTVNLASEPSARAIAIRRWSGIGMGGGVAPAALIGRRCLGAWRVPDRRRQTPASIREPLFTSPGSKLRRNGGSMRHALGGLGRPRPIVSAPAGLQREMSGRLFSWRPAGAGRGGGAGQGIGIGITARCRERSGVLPARTPAIAGLPRLCRRRGCPVMRLLPSRRSMPARFGLAGKQSIGQIVRTCADRRTSPAMMFRPRGKLETSSGSETLERAKGFEPSTPTLARLCSTTELHPHPCRAATTRCMPQADGDDKGLRQNPRRRLCHRLRGVSCRCWP